MLKSLSNLGFEKNKKKINLKTIPMYISISPQKQGGNYQKSSGRFVAYLEKENEENINMQRLSIVT